MLDKPIRLVRIHVNCCSMLSTMVGKSSEDEVDGLKISYGLGDLGDCLGGCSRGRLAAVPLPRDASGNAVLEFATLPTRVSGVAVPCSETA